MATAGLVFTKSDAEQYIRDYYRQQSGERTVDTMYGNVALGAQQQIQDLGYDYDKAIGEAYASAYKQKQDVLSSNLGQGFKQEDVNSIDYAMDKAYASYRDNYLTGVNKIYDDTNKSINTIDTIVDNEAKNLSNMYDTGYDYLKALYTKYSQGDDSENIFKNNENWAKYLNAEGELKSAEEVGFTTKLDDGSYTITPKFTDFFDQMLNDEALKGGYSYNQWLSDVSADKTSKYYGLYDWATSYSGLNYNASYNNLGSFKEAVGLKANDYDYSFAERAFGKSQKDIQKEIDDLVSSSSGKGEEEVYNQLVAYSEKYGIKDDLFNNKDFQIAYNKSLKDVSEAKQKYDIMQSAADAQTENSFASIFTPYGIYKQVKSLEKVINGTATENETIEAFGGMLGVIVAEISNTSNADDKAKDAKENYDNTKKQAYKELYEMYNTMLLKYTEQITKY